MMYGMLTGTASTGIILLREIDGEFKTPASDNMVYQQIQNELHGAKLVIVSKYRTNEQLMHYYGFKFSFLLISLLLKVKKRF